MDFKLTEEQFMLIESLRNMGRRENFKALAAEIDATGKFPEQLMPKFAEMGLLGMSLSTEYGGQGQPSLTAILAIEELAKFGPMIAAPVFESNVGAVRVIDLFGTEEQKKSIIPGVCDGRYSVSVCMTEPEAGSDLTSLTTKAVDKGDHFLLNGRKVFITGGGHASHYLVYVRFSDVPGIQGHWRAAGGKRHARLHLRQAGGVHGAQRHALLRPHFRGRGGAQRKPGDQGRRFQEPDAHL